MDIAALNKNALSSELLRLSKEQWRQMDSLQDGPLQDATDDTEDNLLVFVDKDADDFGSIVQAIMLDINAVNMSEHDATLLFLVISRIIAENLREIIPDESFCFTDSDRFYRDKNKLVDENIYKIDNRQAVALGSEIDTLSAFIAKMTKENFVQRVVTYLSQASDEPLSSLSQQEVLEKTSIVTNPAIWHSLASPEPIKQVLNAIRVEFILNDSQLSLKISDIAKF